MIRIAIVEDQAMVLGAIASLLAFEGDMTIVGRALGGNTALALVRNLSPDILLTDIEMPGRRGINLAARLSAENLVTRVVIVTTFARLGYLARARAAGVRGYLLQDTPVERLSSAICTVHGGGRAIAADLAAEAWEAGPYPLTDREHDTLRLAKEGLPNREIGLRLSLSTGTMRNYLSEAAVKLGATNRIEAGRTARANGWL